MVHKLPPVLFLCLLSLTTTALGFLSGVLFVHEEKSTQPTIRFVEDQTPRIPTLRIENYQEGHFVGYMLESDLRVLLPDSSLTFSRGSTVRIPLTPLLPPSLSQVQEACAYVASKSSTIFHEGTSSSGARIKKENRRCFPTVEAAREAGFAPSKALLEKLSSS